MYLRAENVQISSYRIVIRSLCSVAVLMALARWRLIGLLF